MITRFAPAPTGHLHLGHVVNALFVWQAARSSGGRVRLRIEDHDRQRCRPEYEAAIIEDLAWLGFEPHGPLTRQSERDAIYRTVLEPLVARGLVYGCTCTRAEIEAAAAHSAPVHPAPLHSAPIHPAPPHSAPAHSAPLHPAPVHPAPIHPELHYPGTCRGRGIRLDDRVGWRLRLDPGVERFDDGLCGPQAQDPSEQCGDLLLRDRLGNWTYQFAVTVDDHEQGITDVIRGIDLLASTGRQIRLARLMGRAEPPRFAHHPLVMKSPTDKLSKSDGDSGVRELRAAGWTAADVKERAAEAVGRADLLP